ncbi:MAG TPA: hypothetical protein VHL78_03285 [Actinomycetota bacterium]|nr:hypothetical protein [Actinomycetota bacterium]
MEISHAGLLAVWEQGSARDAVERPLALLVATTPGASWADVASLPLGARDRRLVRLREDLFGTEVAASWACSACGHRLEVSFSTNSLPTEEAPDAGERLLSHGPYRVRFRLPTGEDLATARDEQTVEGAAVRLLDRCLIECRRDDAVLAAADLPPEVIDAVEAAMEEADPGADLWLEGACTGCGKSNVMAFDIASYLWAEIHASAVRVLWDVHALASAYGWSEDAILAMAPARRRAYVELVTG